jgi:hypothetical protein
MAPRVSVASRAGLDAVHRGQCLPGPLREAATGEHHRARARRRRRPPVGERSLGGPAARTVRSSTGRRHGHGIAGSRDVPVVAVERVPSSTEVPGMQIAIVGLSRTGANKVRRLLRGGYEFRGRGLRSSVGATVSTDSPRLPPGFVRLSEEAGRRPAARALSRCGVYQPAPGGPAWQRCWCHAGSKALHLRRAERARRPRWPRAPMPCAGDSPWSIAAGSCASASLRGRRVDPRQPAPR